MLAKASEIYWPVAYLGARRQFWVPVFLEKAPILWKASTFWEIRVPLEQAPPSPRPSVPYDYEAR